MSQYVEWLNQIKLKADQEWLTHSQQKVYLDLLQRWPAEIFVCLTGPSGCGKSFIGRLLAKESDFSYVDELKQATPGQQQIVLDGEEYTRLMRPTAKFLGLRKVILLMRQPPRDAMPTAVLRLDEKDVKQFQHNMTKYGVLEAFHTTAQGTDLGQIMRAEAVQRGGNCGN